jgi:hypothetical protein
LTDQWYLYQNGQRIGPLSWQDLYEKAVSNNLKAEDLVWNEDIGDWKRVDSVPELLSLQSAKTPSVSPPPLVGHNTPVYSQQQAPPPPQQVEHNISDNQAGGGKNSGNPVAKPVKKKRTGCMVVLIIMIAIAGAVIWFALSLFGIFGPKDLGVAYSEADYESALQKIGTEITFEGKSGDELREYTRRIKSEGIKYPIDDYVWNHSDFQEKSFELTSAEATALLNEIAPAFWWFENQQIKVLSDGMVEASGTGLLRKAVDDLYPKLKNDIPVPLFEKVNLYAKGGISIRDNQLNLGADTFNAGPIGIVSAEMLNENAFYFEALYRSIPGLIIYSLEINDSGNIEVDALIPQKTEIIRR